MPSALFVTTVDITLEAFLVPFARHLRSNGWTVDALAADAQSNERLTEEFDHVFDISWSRNPLSPTNLLGAARRVREVVATRGHDLVWVHTPVAAFVTRRALRFRSLEGPAVVYTAHGFHFHTGGNPLTNEIYRFAEKTAAKWTDELVTINEEDLEAARGLGTIPPSSIHLIRGIGVDTERFKPQSVPKGRRDEIRRELGASRGDMLLTMVAEFTANKRHDLALEALKQVTNQKVHLTLVGDGPLSERVREQIQALGLEKRVTMAGYRKDIDEVVASSDALLLCSKREGLNRSALEAMSSGIPVLGTPTRGITDAIGPDEGGWIASSHKPDALAWIIEQAAGDARARSQRGQAARKRVVEHFDQSCTLLAYDEVFSAGLYRRQEALKRSQTSYDKVKRVLDILGSAAMLILLAPLLVLLALGVLVTMGLPVLFKQSRPGLHEEIFTLYKFRTMRTAKETESDVEAVASDSDRLTAFGRFLRKTSFDELPQLFNVLRGDMSFVGPRPLLVDYLEHYTAEQAVRHSVRPGITGWAQVNGRNDAGWDDRFAMDAYYARNYSLGLDARILLMTVGVALSRKGVSASGEATVRPFTSPAESADIAGEDIDSADDRGLLSSTVIDGSAVKVATIEGGDE